MSSSCDQVVEQAKYVKGGDFWSWVSVSSVVSRYILKPVCFFLLPGKISAGCVSVTGRPTAASTTSAVATKKTQILSTRASRLRPEKPSKSTSSTLRGWVSLHQAFRHFKGVFYLGEFDLSVFLLLLFFSIQTVGEPQQVFAIGGSDVPEDPGEDPGEGDEQPRDLDRLAVPA